MENKSYKCEKCHKEFEKRQSYAGHRSQCLGKVNHAKARANKKHSSPKKIIGDFKCTKCNKSFTTNLGLYSHQGSCGHTNQSKRFGNIDIVGSYICECKVEFKTKRAKNAHWGSCNFNPQKALKYKRYVYKDKSFDSSWEVEYAKFLDSKNIKWIREPKGFEYFLNNKKRVYYPDFYLPETNEYIEIKGYEIEQDKVKWEQFPEKLTVLKKQNLLDLGLKIK